jgi:hypothetical protein
MRLFSIFRDKSLPKQFLEDVKDGGKYTPDRWYLDTFKTVRLFIYGDMMLGHKRHDFIEGWGETRRLGWGFTAPIYTLWQWREGENCLQLATTYSHKGFAPATCVKGELWKVPTQVLYELDKELMNGYVYDRIRIPIGFPHHRKIANFHTIKYESRYETFPCWAYMANEEYWADALRHGNTVHPVRIFRPNNEKLKPYYFYRSVERISAPNVISNGLKKDVEQPKPAS